MKLLSILFLFTFSMLCNGQNLLDKTHTTTLIDSSTNNYFVLDESNTHLSAYNSKGIKLWTSFTKSCSFTPRDTLPVEIYNLHFGYIKSGKTGKKSKNEKVLFACNGNCWGYFKLDSGDYHSLGCD